VSKPTDAGTVAERVYTEFEPVQHDEALPYVDYALLKFLGGLGRSIQVVEDLTRDPDTPIWSKTVDLSRAPLIALPWLGQFVGSKPPQRNVGESDEDYAVRLRTHIASVEGWARGTPNAIKAAVQAYLIGTKEVMLTERDTSAYHFDIRTRMSETLGAFDAAGAPLTVTGAPITDAIRAARASGDGLDSDKSFGIWEATTNLLLNGGFETNITGWVGTGTPVRSTTKSKFGTASLRVTTVGGPNDSASTSIGNGGGIAAGDVVTFSVWVNPDVTISMNLQINEMLVGGGLNAFSEGGNVVCPAGVWTRLTYTRTLIANTTQAEFYVTTGGVQPATNVYIDGVQVEKKPFATPYVETNGATASRATGRVRAPSSLLDSTQGWVAFRTRLGWGNANEPGAGAEVPHWFNWGAFPNNIPIAYFEAANQWVISRDAGGSTPDVVINGSLVPGQLVTVVGAWDSGRIRLSVDGSAFSNLANTAIPVGLPATFEIGSSDGSDTNHGNSDMLWFACGKGTLTDADAAKLHSYGNNDPEWDAFVGDAAITALMPFDTDAYYDQSFTSPKIVAAITANKPAGLQFTYSVVPDWTIDDLDAGYATYNAIDADYATYDAIDNNNP